MLVWLSCLMHTILVKLDTITYTYFQEVPHVKRQGDPGKEVISLQTTARSSGVRPTDQHPVIWGVTKAPCCGHGEPCSVQGNPLEPQPVLIYIKFGSLSSVTFIKRNIKQQHNNNSRSVTSTLHYIESIVMLGSVSQSVNRNLLKVPNG